MKKLISIFLILTLCCLPAFSKTKDKTTNKDVPTKGYMGTLPDITEKFDKSRPAASTPVFEAQEGFTDPNELKPVPRDNPAFINVILKSDRTSRYINDINEVIPLLENVITCIEEDADVQIFVAKANFLDLNVDYIRQKYTGEPESYYASFKALMDVNLHTQAIATMRAEAIVYSRYLAYSGSGSIYNPQNISQQLEYLKEELLSALITLKEAE